MSAYDAAQLLDKLMGRDRNSLPSERIRTVTWDSPEVCHYHLVKFCPHDLFTNTKSDLGPCLKVHDDELKSEFEQSDSHRRVVYEDEFMRFAETMLADVDRRIEKGRQRLALSVQDALANTSTGDGRVDEQIQLLSERITGLVAEAERLGSEGNVEEAQGLSKLCDKLREERDQLRRSSESSVWHQVMSFAAEMAASQEKQMEVCEICGAFLIVGDAQQRIDDHLTGKQHVGYAKLRTAIQEIRETRFKAREDREKQRERRETERKKQVEEERRKEKEREERRSRRNSRERFYEEERRDRDRDRSRESDRHRKQRPRDQDHNRPRDHDHHPKERDHKDRREKDRDRHSSRSEYRRSKSRDRRDSRHSRDEDSRRVRERSPSK